MNKDSNKKTFIKSKSLWVILGLIIVILIILVSSGNSSKDNKQTKNRSTSKVMQGPLTIDVTEPGTIKAREQVIIKNEVEGRTAILSLIPEATKVKKGDLLVELDATQLKDDRINLQIEVQNAESSFISARENLAVTQNQAKSDVEKAELELEFAKLDLVKYEKGEYPNQLNEMKQTILLKEQEVQKANDKYTWSKRLADEKYISEIELTEDRLAYEKANLDLELAKKNLELLEQYTNYRDLTELKSNVSQAEFALDRIKRKASADIVQAEADLKANDLKFERQKTILEKLENQITKATIYAPSDGMVIYATSAKGSWRGDDEPLTEGREVHEREELIYLPTAESVTAEIRVHESNMNKVKIGVPVEVEIDALPGKIFNGTVAKIAVLPDAQMMWMNPDLKVYTTEIYVDGDTKDLRTGMSCKARIIIEEYKNATYIPVQAVVRIGDQPTVYVVEDGTSKPRPVEIGLDNNRMIHIISGLKPGETVDLTPPLDTSEVNGRNGASRGNGKKKPSPGDGKPEMESRPSPPAGMGEQGNPQMKKGSRPSGPQGTK